MEALSSRGPRLRLVCINDVYTLDNLPKLKTFVSACLDRGDADVTLTTLAGDFVSPSLLSSLDRGFGMVDCIDAVPITHVCFGNHEQDVPYEALIARAKQFRGTWLNTNMPGFAHPLPASQVVEVRAPNGRLIRVGLVGVVTEDPSLYPARAFAGNTLLPAHSAVLDAARQLVEVEGCACVIPLTHQSIERDLTLARSHGAQQIPVILGGHEHEPHVEQVGNTWVVKTGQDAVYAAVVELTWPPEAPLDGHDAPVVSVHLEPMREWADDPALRVRADHHMAAVKALECEVLLRFDSDRPLTSVGTRVRQTSVGAMLATKVREVLGVDVCFINGGGIRGNREYARVFTYGDLEAELPFANEVVEISMPGRVLREVVAGSRAHAPKPAPGFLQVDDGVAVTDDHTVIAVGGAPLDEDREYRVATVRVLFDGMDNIDALLRFTRAHPERVPPRDAGRELKLVVLDSFARTLWQRLGPFESIDRDGDQQVSADDLREAVRRVTKTPPSPLLIEGIVRAFDTDGDGSISREESERGPWRR